MTYIIAFFGFLFVGISWLISIFTTYIIPVIAIFLIIYAINQSNNTELGDNHTEVVKKYKQAIEVLNSNTNLKTYKELVNNIFNEDKKLYKESLPHRKSYNKLLKVKNELTQELKKIDLDNRRLENSKQLLLKTNEKLEVLNKYIMEVDEAIENTGIDFVNIKAELELKNVNTNSLPNIDVLLLKERAKSLSYLQKKLPVLED